MVAGKRTTYKRLIVKKQHGSNMKIIVAGVFAVLVLTGITGHLFSRREVTTPSLPSPSPHHEALAKLIRTSEDAIGWIGNKTLDSIKNMKNFTASVVTPESPLITEKNKVLEWLRRAIHYNSSGGTAADSTNRPLEDTGSVAADSSGQALGDSGESVVIAHRTPGNGFSWGPPKNKKSEEGQASSSTGLFHAAGRRMRNALSFLFLTSRNITQKGKNLLQSGVDKVKTTKESLASKFSKWKEKLNASAPSEDTGTPPFEEEDQVCAVDWPRRFFASFPNRSWVETYNREHGTGFTIYDSHFCKTLFTAYPENYQKIENLQL